MRKVSYTSDAIHAYFDQEVRKGYKVISPSALGNCMRVHYWRLKGLFDTTPPTPAAKTNFQVGRAWERFMASVFRSQGMLEQWFEDGKSKSFYIPGLRLGGTPDLLIKVDGELIVLDSKTMASKAFTYRRNLAKKAQVATGMSLAEYWYEDQKPYVMQIGCYIMLLQEAGYDVSKGALAFASKDDGYVGMELEIELTDALRAEIESRCKALMGYFDRDELPPCECEGWKVGYCGFGNPATRIINATKKEVNSECCQEKFVLPLQAKLKAEYELKVKEVLNVS